MCREAARLALNAVAPALTSRFVSTLADVRILAGDAALIVLDLGLPDNRDMTGLIELSRSYPRLPIVVVTGSERADIERQVKMCGARGYVSKAAPVTEMIAAFRLVLDGGEWFSPAVDALPADDALARLASLTAAESRVLNAMRDGRLNKQIAFDLGLSEITVKTHVKAILRKLGAGNRTQAVLMLHALADERAGAMPPPRHDHPNE